MASKSRVLYVPVTKAASTTVKALLAEAERTFIEPLLDFTPYSSAFAADNVHSPKVHGLLPYRELSFKDKLTALQSDEWWRVAVIRNPYDRLVSTRQNRVLMLGMALPNEIRSSLELCVDDSGCLDVAASFEWFVTTLYENRQLFFIDDHFRPQSRALRCPNIDFTHVVRLEEPCHLDEFRSELSTRVERELSLCPYNKGLGIRTWDVMTDDLARLVEDVYSEDFENLGYRRSHLQKTATAPSFSVAATRLTLFLQDVVSDRERRRGARYGAREVWDRVIN